MDEKEQFNEKAEVFITTFPTRTPSGRILSPASGSSIYGGRVVKKLRTVTKGKINLLEDIIGSLAKEISYRKNSGNIEYMKAVEAWLNSGSWENEYEVGKEVFTGVPIGRSI